MKTEVLPSAAVVEHRLVKLLLSSHFPSEKEQVMSKVKRCSRLQPQQASAHASWQPTVCRRWSDLIMSDREQPPISPFPDSLPSHHETGAPHTIPFSHIKTKPTGAERPKQWPMPRPSEHTMRSWSVTPAAAAACCRSRAVALLADGGGVAALYAAVHRGAVGGAARRRAGRIVVRGALVRGAP